MQDSSLGTQTKLAVEALITSLAEERIRTAATIHPRYEKMWRAISDISTNGGKRVRPYLTMVGYGGFSHDVVPVAAAQEFVHIAMLMHDDIIDQDDVRHGHDNINGIYRKEYVTYLDELLATHYAYGTGIISGDALISEAYLLLATSDFSNDVKKKLAERLHTSIFEVIGGELLDVEAAFVGDGSITPALVSRYKTASYSFIGPLVSGAVCADADTRTIEALTTYGRNAGIAFQLQDDLLGVFSDEGKTGKSNLTDLQEAKDTQLIREHAHRMDDVMRERFDRLFGDSDASHWELTSLKEDLEASGAKEAVETAIREHFEAALASIKDLPQAKELETFTYALGKRFL